MNHQLTYTPLHQTLKQNDRTQQTNNDSIHLTVTMTKSERKRENGRTTRHTHIYIQLARMSGVEYMKTNKQHHVGNQTDDGGGGGELL